MKIYIGLHKFTSFKNWQFLIKICIFVTFRQTFIHKIQKLIKSNKKRRFTSVYIIQKIIRYYVKIQNFHQFFHLKTAKLIKTYELTNVNEGLHWFTSFKKSDVIKIKNFSFSIKKKEFSRIPLLTWISNKKKNPNQSISNQF